MVSYKEGHSIVVHTDGRECVLDAEGNVVTEILGTKKKVKRTATAQAKETMLYVKGFVKFWCPPQ